MAVTLDPATGQRVQREIDLDHARDAAEVIACAVRLLDYAPEITVYTREAVTRRLDESMAQGSRGECYTPAVARDFLAATPPKPSPAPSTLPSRARPPRASRDQQQRPCL